MVYGEWQTVYTIGQDYLQMKFFVNQFINFVIITISFVYFIFYRIIKVYISEWVWEYIVQNWFFPVRSRSLICGFKDGSKLVSGKIYIKIYRIWIYYIIYYNKNKL